MSEPLCLHFIYTNSQQNDFNFSDKSVLCETKFIRFNYNFDPSIRVIIHWILTKVLFKAKHNWMCYNVAIEIGTMT